MRALLLLILSLLLSWQILAQNESTPPLKLLEVSLASYELTQAGELKEDILTLVKSLKVQDEFKSIIPVYTQKLETLYSLPQVWQTKILKKLLSLMDASEKLELISLVTKGLYAKTFHDEEMAKQYDKKMHELKMDIQTGFPDEGIDEVAGPEYVTNEATPQDDKLQKIIDEQVKLEEVDVYDGFDIKPEGELPIGDAEIKENLYKVLKLHQEIREEELKRLSKLDVSSDKAMEEYIKEINTDRLIIGGDDHAIGKSKKTLIYADNDVDANLITKIVLKDSPDAHIVLPADFDINSKHFKEYLFKQHRLAGATDMGFQDLNVLDNPASKKNLDYWRAQFKKKVITRGRNVFIYKIDNDGNIQKVMYSPRANLWKPRYWTSGQGFKIMKAVYVKPSSLFNYQIGALFGALQMGAAMAVKYAIGQEEEVIAEASKKVTEAAVKTNVSAYLSFAYATVIGGNYGTFNNIVKSGKKMAKISKNFAITTLTFGYLVYAINHYFFNVEAADLNIFGEHAMQALQNHYKIWALGFWAKIVAEPYKALTDALKDSRMTTGQVKLSFNFFGKHINWKPRGTKWYLFVDQTWHLLRTTFKNIALEMSIGTTVLATTGALSIFGVMNKLNLTIGGFEFWGTGQNILLLSMVVGTNATYLIGKLAKVDKKSPKAKKLILNSYWIFNIGERIDPYADKVVNGIYSAANFISRSLKSGANYMRNALCNDRYLPPKI